MAAISAPASACCCSACCRSATGGDYRSANVAKNLVISLNTLRGFGAGFIANGAVSWPQTLAMMVGCLIGGFCGAHLARVVPQEVDADRGDRRSAPLLTAMCSPGEYWF